MIGEAGQRSTDAKNQERHGPSTDPPRSYSSRSPRAAAASGALAPAALAGAGSLPAAKPQRRALPTSDDAGGHDHSAVGNARSGGRRRRSHHRRSAGRAPRNVARRSWPGCDMLEKAGFGKADEAARVKLLTEYSEAADARGEFFRVLKDMTVDGLLLDRNRSRPGARLQGQHLPAGISRLPGRGAPLMPQDFDHDVVVIGSGAAGGMAAWNLTRKGVKVLLLEAGSRFSRADFWTHVSPWEARERRRRGEQPPQFVLDHQGAALRMGRGPLLRLVARVGCRRQDQHLGTRFAALLRSAISTSRPRTAGRSTGRSATRTSGPTTTTSTS